MPSRFINKYIILYTVSSVEMAKISIVLNQTVLAKITLYTSDIAALVLITTAF